MSASPESAPPAEPLSHREPRRHHGPDGKFRNPWPGVPFHGVVDFLRWAAIERVAKRLPKQPSPEIFSRVTPGFSTPRAGADQLVVTWIGHTSFLIQLGGYNILLDPVWSERASPVSFVGPKRWVSPGIVFAELPPIDLVVISHDHYDHLDRPTVRRLLRSHSSAQWIAPLGVGRWLRKRGAVMHAELDWWETTTFGSLAITCTPAQHFSGRSATNRNATLWSGWTLRARGGDAHSRALFFAGDTAYHPEFAAIARALGPFDAAILPIGAYDPRWFMGAVHMDASQAVDAYADLAGVAPEYRCTFVASHWGTFKLTDEPMDEPPKLARARWNALAMPEDRLWIPRHGESRIIESGGD